MRRASVAGPGVAVAASAAVVDPWTRAAASHDRGGPDRTARAATLVPTDAGGEKRRDLQRAAQLAAPGDAGELEISLLADKATVVDDRTSEASSWRAARERPLQVMRRQGLAPEALRRQQGDADARAGTHTRASEAGLGQLRVKLRQCDVDATIQGGRSARRPPMHGEDVRTAHDRMAASHRDVKFGSNFDALAGDLRVEGHHFGRVGLNAASRLMESAFAGWRR